MAKPFNGIWGGGAPPRASLVSRGAPSPLPFGVHSQADV